MFTPRDILGALFMGAWNKKYIEAERIKRQTGVEITDEEVINGPAWMGEQWIKNIIKEEKEK